MARTKDKYYIVRLDDYSGATSSLETTVDNEMRGNMYAIIHVTAQGAFVSDYGYGSAQEAKDVCPEAEMPMESF